MSDVHTAIVGAAHRARLEVQERIQSAIQHILDREKTPFALTVHIDNVVTHALEDEVPMFFYNARVRAEIPEGE